MSNIVVRNATPTDAAAIEALYRELVGQAEVCVLPQRIAEVADDPCTALFVAELRGIVAGTMLVSLCQDVMYRNQPFAVVENIVVASTCRGAGVGSALMREVERYCQAAQCSKIMLLSSATRPEAHRFFEQAGFSGSVKKGFVKYRSQFAAPA
jgi:N-acetylglutamate synthase-like GNAT family acetyltransferase